MKALKIAGLIILIILILATVVSVFLPSSIHAERSLLINRPAELVFNQVNHLKTWKKWSYWDNIDPQMQSTYEGPEAGVGAIHKWRSTDDMAGAGTLTITESFPNEKIVTTLNFEGMGISTGGWLFASGDSGTNVTTYMDIELPFFGRIFPGLVFEKMLNDDFDKTLNGLKKHCESLPLAEEKEWEISVMQSTPLQIMSIKITCKPSEIGMQLGESYGKIGEAMMKQGLKQSGPVLAVYESYSADKVVMEPAIPVDKSGKSEGNIIARELPSVQVMKLDFYGDYIDTEKAHIFMDEWARKEGKTISGAPWEEYVTDPTVEKDTTKWLTRIYYPIQ